MTGFPTHPDFDNETLWNEIYLILPDGFADTSQEDDPYPSFGMTTDQGDVKIYVCPLTMPKECPSGFRANSVVFTYEHHEDDEHNVWEVFTIEELEDICSLIDALIG